MFNNFKLNVARKLLASFLIDIRKHPEKVQNNGRGGVYVHQNYLVAQGFETIDELKKESEI